jgi:hypothetical protein
MAGTDRAIELGIASAHFQNCGIVEIPLANSKL